MLWKLSNSYFEFHDFDLKFFFTGQVTISTEVLKFQVANNKCDKMSQMHVLSFKNKELKINQSIDCTGHYFHLHIWKTSILTSKHCGWKKSPIKDTSCKIFLKIPTAIISITLSTGTASCIFFLKSIFAHNPNIPYT